MPDSAALRRHRRIYYLLRPAIRVYLRLAFGFVPPALVEDEGPFLMICNHVTDLDMLFTSCLFRQHMYYVASEHTMRAGFASRLLTWACGPIIRKKGTVAAATGMEMKRAVKHGCSVGLFGEGERSSDGVNRPVIASTGSMARMLACTLYTVRLHGGYLSSPRWGRGIRRGRMTIEVAGRYSPEQLRAMKPDEVTALINRDIYVDAYADNARDKIAYRGKHPAEGIQHALLVCPQCKKLNTIQSSGSRFFCPCGMQGTYDDYGLLSGSGFDFTTITQWSRWAKAHIAGLPEAAPDEILCSDDNQLLRSVAPDHTVTVADSGRLTLTRDCLTVGATALPIADMAVCDMIAHGYLLVSMKDGRYYEIKNKEHRFSGLLYLLLIERYHPGIANL